MSNETQTPDTKPGDYYVTMVRDDGDRGRRVAWLAGPFRDDHAGALAMVDQARAIAEEVDPRAFWDAFGTSRVDHFRGPTGVLNARLGLTGPRFDP